MSLISQAQWCWKPVVLLVNNKETAQEVLQPSDKQQNSSTFPEDIQKVFEDWP